MLPSEVDSNGWELGRSPDLRFTELAAAFPKRLSFSGVLPRLLALTVAGAVLDIHRLPNTKPSRFIGCNTKKCQAAGLRVTTRG